MLGKHADALHARVSPSESGRAGVRIFVKCSCYKDNKEKAFPVWLSTTGRGRASTIEQCGKLAAEDVLEVHPQCLGIVPPSKKRTWLDDAQRQAEHESAKKKKVRLCIHGNGIAFSFSCTYMCACS